MTESPSPSSRTEAAMRVRLFFLSLISSCLLAGAIPLARAVAAPDTPKPQPRAGRNPDRSGLAAGSGPSFGGKTRWSGYFLSFVDFAQNPAKGFHYSETRLGYAFAPNIAFGTRVAYMGPTRPTPGWQPDFGDPELGLDVRADLPGFSAEGPFALIAGSYAIFPLSRNSHASDISNGWMMYAGFDGKLGGWSVRQTNAFAFLDHRRAQGSLTTVVAGEDVSDSAPVDSGPKLKDPNVLTTEIRLQAGRPFTLLNNVWWQNDVWYVRVERSSAAPDQIFRFGTTLGYGWNSHLTTFAGFACESPFGRPNDPPIFAAELWAFRIGIFAPL